MDNRVKFVHREETFNDLAVRELAKVRSACLCKVQFERCNKDECKNCYVKKRYDYTVSQMNEYDKSRLSMYITDQYVIDSYNPTAWMSYKRLKSYWRKFYTYWFGFWGAISLLCIILDSIYG